MSFDLAPFGSLFSTPQKNGLTRPKSVRGSGVPMVNMNELFAFSRIHNIEMDLVPIVDKESHFLLETEDLLFARQSLVLAGAGKCSIFIGNTKPTVFESHIIRCRLNKTVSNPYFYYYFFQSVHGRIVMETIAEQGAGASGIRGSDLVKLLVPCPSKSYQDAIVKILTPLDDRISLLRETNTTLEAIAKTLFKSWFVDFDPVKAKAEGRLPEGMDEATAALFPSEFEESALGLIPKGWSVRNINQVCDLGRGSSPRPIQQYMGNDVPWIKIADATASDGMFVFETKEKIIKEGVKNSMPVKHGDLIMSNSASCGITVFVELEGCIHDGWLYFKNYQFVTKGFLFFWLRKIAAHLISIADGTVQKNLNIAMVSSQLILCPPANVVDAFEDIASSLLTRIRENCKQYQTLTTLRDTLLPRLISGQLRLNQAQQIIDEVGA
jgi:type I restriction enzyme S subunit